MSWVSDVIKAGYKTGSLADVHEEQNVGLNSTERAAVK